MAHKALKLRTLVLRYVISVLLDLVVVLFFFDTFIFDPFLLSAFAILIIAVYQFLIFLDDSLLSKSVANHVFKYLKSKSFCINSIAIPIAAYVGAMLIISTLQTYSLGYVEFDNGTFHQILNNLVHGRGFESTMTRSGNFLFDHLSPSLAILAPLFFVTGSHVLTLPLLQPFLIAAGMSSWIWLALRIRPGQKAMLTDSVRYTILFSLLFPPLWAARSWGFHENSIAFVSTSWAFCLILALESKWAKGKYLEPLIVLLLIISAGSKEIVALDIFFLSLIWGLYKISNRQTSKGIFLFLLSGAILTMSLHFILSFHPADKDYATRYYSYIGNSFHEVTDNLLHDPFYILRKIGYGHFLAYFFSILAPLFFVPLLAVGKLPQLLNSEGRKNISCWPWTMVVLPSCFSVILASKKSMANLDFHYSMELWPILIPLTVLFLTKWGLDTKWWRWWVVLGMFIPSLLLGVVYRNPFSELVRYSYGALERRDVIDAFKLIPLEDSVVADDFAGAWFANHRFSMTYPYTELIPGGCPDWAVVNRDTIELKCPYTLIKVIDDFYFFKKSPGSNSSQKF